MRRLAALALASSTLLAVPAAAQSLQGLDQVSMDAGLGVTYGPEYMGSDESDASPWFILRNLTLGTAEGEKQGLGFTPSLNYIGKRDASDFDDLAGMNNVDAAGEIGLKVSYVTGPFNSYGNIRKGFGGHDGVVGEIGTKYRFAPTDKLTLWTGVQVALGDDKFTDTYFGVDSDEVAPGRGAYNPDGGAYEAELSLEARYMLTPETSVLGRITYGQLLGDAADSPIVQDESQPAISIGIARRLNFRF